jgi:hypothetical protein
MVYDGRMKTRQRPRTKALDVPAPSRAQFDSFVRQLVGVPKTELDRREVAWKKVGKNRKKK